MGERITIRFYPTELPKRKKGFFVRLFNRIKTVIRKFLSFS